MARLTHLSPGLFGRALMFLLGVLLLVKAASTGTIAAAIGPTDVIAPELQTPLEQTLLLGQQALLPRT